MTTPQPRPALRRADDAGVHPALAVAPSQAPPMRLRQAEPAQPELKPAKTKAKPKTGKGTSSSAETTAEARQPLRSAGRATSDSLRPARDKKVVLQVKVPKSTRKQLRAVARHSGTSVDQLVVAALTDWLGDPRRW